MNFGLFSAKSDVGKLIGKSRESLLKGRISSIDLLVLTSIDQLLLILKIFFFLIYQLSFLNKEVNGTKLSSTVRFPCKSVAKA